MYFTWACSISLDYVYSSVQVVYIALNYLKIISQHLRFNKLKKSRTLLGFFLTYDSKLTDFVGEDQQIKSIRYQYYKL